MLVEDVLAFHCFHDGCLASFDKGHFVQILHRYWFLPTIGITSPLNATGLLFLLERGSQPLISELRVALVGLRYLFIRKSNYC